MYDLKDYQKLRVDKRKAQKKNIFIAVMFWAIVAIKEKKLFITLILERWKKRFQIKFFSIIARPFTPPLLMARPLREELP